MDTNTLLHDTGASGAPSSNQPSVPGKRKIAVPIREVGARYRESILRHLLALEPHDRYLRFGFAANDEQIRQYVDGLNFERDRVLGIFNRKLELIAMAHLAYPDASASADGASAGNDHGTGGFAEFGVSVAGHARGRGYGTRLFERAATHAVNDGIKTMYIHALNENTPMLRIVRKAGAAVERSGSESDAYLRLPRANWRSRLDELLGARVGQADYLLKAEARRARGLLASVDDMREGVREVDAAVRDIERAKLR